MIRTLVAIAWAPAAVVLGHAVAAAVFGHLPSLDPVFHLLGGVAGASALLALFGRWPQWVPPGRGQALTLLCVVIVAVLWEVGEVVLNQLRWARITTDAPDTALDLVLGVGGALLRVFISGRPSRR